MIETVDTFGRPLPHRPPVRVVRGIAMHGKNRRTGADNPCAGFRLWLQF